MPSLFLSAVLLSGCQHEKLELIAPYFPLEKGTVWCYGISFQGGTEPFTQASWEIAGDTTLDGKSYKLLTNYDQPFKAIREDGGDYYKRKMGAFVNTTSAELRFLRTVNPDGAAWEQEIGDYKYAFSQKLLPEYTLGESTWKEVIEVRIQMSYKDQNGDFQPFIDFVTNEPSFAAYHFVKAVGIVHMSEPAEFNHFSDFAYSFSNELVLMACQ